MSLRDLTRRLLGRRRQDYMLVRNGRIINLPDPLPVFFPRLFDPVPHDRFAARAAMLADAGKLVEELTADCNLRQKKLPGILMHNLGLLLQVPAVYETQLFLRGKGMRRLYVNNFTATAFLQVCAFFSDSDIAEQLQELIVPACLGLLLRYYGVTFLRQEERKVFLQERRFDPFDPRQRRLRDQFLEHYRQVLDRVSSLSVDRFNRLAGQKHGCPADVRLALLHVLRYSPRLMGRAAAPFKPKEVERVHDLAAYAAMVADFAAAWAAGGRKRPALILAEEWNRAKTAGRYQDIHASSLYNLHALSDLFRVCRCRVLANFQGTDRDAIYSSTDNILVREVPMRIDDEVRQRIEDERDLKRDRDKKRTSSTRLRCFTPRERLDHRATSLRDAIAGKVRFGGADPSDTALLPLADQGEKGMGTE